MAQSISTGIKTDQVRDPDPEFYGFRVRWIQWDSPFRETELRIGDLVQGVDGERYPTTQEEPERARAIGQYHEHVHWERLGATDGQTITLEIDRDGEPLRIQGPLRAEVFYHDENKRRSMGPGGPDRIKSDGFRGSWSGWYEDFVKNASRVLDDGWNRGRINNKKELRDHENNRPRVEYLLEHYPGPFAERTVEDWERVRDNLVGRAVTLTDEDLEYRELGAKRVAIVAEAAKEAYAAFMEGLGDDVIPAFPTIDPVEDDRSTVTGKIVELPWITFRSFINDLGNSYAVAGSSREGFHFIDIESPVMDRFFDALFRYQAQVTPNYTERYRFIGKILDDPRMITYRGRPAVGMMLEVIAGSAGDESFFTDLSQSDGKGRAPFAGEALLAGLSPVEVRDDMSPGELVEAMILATKVANQSAWRACFADWRVMSGFSGPQSVDRNYILRDAVYMRVWEHSRRLVEGEVYDARIARVERPRVILEADPDLDVPRVEELKVYIDHFGKVDGEYRAFSNVNVNRRWTIQRLDDGPWKIADVQHL